MNRIDKFYDLMDNAFEEMFNSIFLPVIIFILILAIITIIINYIRHGKSIFSCFKKKNTKNYKNNMFEIILEKIYWYKKILKVSNSIYLLIDQSGITIFYLFLHKGNATEIDESKVEIKSSLSRTLLPNPYTLINEEEKVLRKSIQNVTINKYIVINNAQYISNKSDIKVLKYNKVLYSLKKDKKYTNTEIDEIYEKIKVLNSVK